VPWLVVNGFVDLQLLDEAWLLGKPATAAAMVRSDTMTTDNRWAAILREPGGPAGVHDRVLRLVRDEASEPIQGRSDEVLAGVDEALAAVAALQGPAPCRDFIAAIAPVVDQVGRVLKMFPDSIHTLSMLSLLSISAVAEAVGRPVALPEYDVDAKLTELVRDEELSQPQQVTVALLALDLGRLDTVRARSGKPGPDAARLVAALTPWDAYARGFPESLDRGEGDWIHLLLAARIVLGKIEGVPMGQVAETVHGRLVELAR
jgi:hypothetical protein